MASTRVKKPRPPPMRAAPSPLARPGRAVGPAGPLPRPALAGQTCMAHAAGLAPKAPRPALGRRAGAQRAAARRATLFSAKTRASPSSPTSSSRPAHEVLGVRPGAPPAEVRAAWVALIREAHPDAVGGAGGGGGDAGATAAAATVRAAELNAAYAALGGGGRSAGGAAAAAAAAAASAAAAPDPFAWQATPADADPAATIPFVDPFAVGVDPMAWRALQALARGEGGGGGGVGGGGVASGGGPPGEGGPSAAAPPSSGPFDPEAALAAARLRVPPGGVAWLTPAQAAEVEAVMAGMEALSYEPPFASAVLADLLARAAAVNRGGRPPAY